MAVAAVVAIVVAVAAVVAIAVAGGCCIRDAGATIARTTSSTSYNHTNKKPHATATIAPTTEPTAVTATTNKIGQ